MKKFYIFDMDGTLCGSMEFWRKETAMIEDWSDRAVLEPCQDRMREHYRNDIELKDGAMEFILDAEKRGIKMCIASATRRDVAQPFLEKTGLLEHMEFYIDCYEIHAFKERPDVYLKAAERLGAEVADCVVFEDAEYCIRTAKGAGFFVVGVHDTVAELEGHPERQCDLFIKDWNNVPDI